MTGAGVVERLIETPACVAEGAAVEFIFIIWTFSAFCCADFGPVTGRAFACAVEILMPRQDQTGGFCE